MDKIKVLFICVHNSARSQMAEAFLTALAGGGFEAESAGLEPGVLNPLVVESMKEIGIDISGNTTKSVFDMHKKGKSYDYVITVCDESDAGRCPIFPGPSKRIHWPFEDPSKLEGTDEEKLGKIRAIRDQIKERIEKWTKEA
ncbi:MAG: arsenate reductase ArsC [Candidatus Omnitrophota bacterium]